MCNLSEEIEYRTARKTRRETRRETRIQDMTAFVKMSMKKYGATKEEAIRNLPASDREKKKVSQILKNYPAAA